MKKRVLLGLSGGVDSAVAAYMLLLQGYDVTGCFMRNWDSIANNDILGNPTLSGTKCSQELDYDDAAATAFELSIPILRKDFVDEYWKDVFQYFLDTYRKGYTPDADVFCNKYIKFGSFLDFAKKSGFDMIAMGHYAKRIDENGESHLYKAFDKNKDQSYFLGQISTEQLSCCLFPLESMTKQEVRQKAEMLNLTVAKKKDSTGVCFIGERNFKEFLANYLPAKPGPIVDLATGNRIATHDGVLYYTVGQHKGLNIGGLKGYKALPFFVVGKDVGRNILYVAQEDENEYRFSYGCLLSNFNWIGSDLPEGPLSCNCKFRYRGKDMPVRLEILKGGEARLSYPRYSYVAKGQIACLYLGERLLASGIIEKTYDVDGEEIPY